MSRPLIVDPADPWWLLRLKIERGECIPFHFWLIFAHQMQTIVFAPELPA